MIKWNNLTLTWAHLPLFGTLLLPNHSLNTCDIDNINVHHHAKWVWWSYSYSNSSWDMNYSLVTDRQKIVHMSPQCNCTGGLQKGTWSPDHKEQWNCKKKEFGRQIECRKKCAYSHLSRKNRYLILPNRGTGRISKVTSNIMGRKLGFWAFQRWFRIGNRTIIKETVCIFEIYDRFGFPQTMGGGRPY